MIFCLFATFSHPIIPGNEVGTEGARAIAESPRTNTTVTELNLGVITIGSFVLLLHTHRHTRIYHQSFAKVNDIEYEGIKSITETLKGMSSMTKLNLGVK